MTVRNIEALPRLVRIAGIVSAILAVSAGFALFYSRLEPFSMDEVLVHHAFACARAPLNFQNRFRESCHEYLLDLPLFGSLPLRSFAYVGSIHSIFYTPVYWLWAHPYSSRAFGIAMLGVQAFCIHRLCGAPWLVVGALLLCWFPYSFQHLVDTGQLSLQITALFGFALCAQAWMRRLRTGRSPSGAQQGEIALGARACLPAAMTGALLSFGLFVRLSFLFVIPGTLLVLAAYMCSVIASRRLPARRVVPGIFVFLVFATIPSLLLLLGEDPRGRTYFEIAFSSSGGGGMISRADFAPRLLTLLRYVTDPLSSAHVLFHIPDLDLHGIGFGALGVAILAVSVHRARGRRRQGLALVSYAAGALTFVLVALAKKSWAMHHVMLAYPFVILAVSLQWATRSSQKRFLGRIGSVLFVSFALYGLSLYGRLWRMTPRNEHMIGVVDTTEYVSRRFASDHVVVVADWGLYYVQALYGPPSQAVLFADWRHLERFPAEISKVARELNRKLVVLTYGNNRRTVEPLARLHPMLPRTGFRVAEGNWYIWVERAEERAPERTDPPADL